MGTGDERAVAAAVRDMFSAIAPRYDLANHILSLNVDRWWWRRAAAQFDHILSRADAAALDLCCGTGDMALALSRRARGASIVGIDFSHPMLRLARHKAAGRIGFIEADVLALPYQAGRFDLVVSAFGFRNLANYDAGLREIVRVLRARGEVGILDFSEPDGLFGAVYRIYFKRILPALGTMISGVKGPYAYLPASVERFPAPAEMLQRMRAAGLRSVSWMPYTFGIAGLYHGIK